MRLFENANYDFITVRRKAYAFSGIILAIGVAAMVYFQVAAGGWVNYGVDFTGGTLIQVDFQAPTDPGELRDLLEPDFPGVQVTRFGEENEYLIRTAEFTEQGVNVSDAVDATLERAFEPGDYRVVRTEAVGPQVGAELQQRALLAILLSFGATLIYLAFRFEWRFGLAAVVAVLHDSLLTLGFISLFRFEVAVTTVAAVLTIIGYSLNDTIIIFDRIRENLKAAGRREDSVALINRSINETLPRTVMTGGTTLATLLALALFTSGIIQEFAIILIFGIVIGTYSSIFVASPILLEIEERWGEKHAGKKASRPRRQERAAV